MNNLLDTVFLTLTTPKIVFAATDLFLSVEIYYVFFKGLFGFMMPLFTRFIFSARAHHPFRDVMDHFINCIEKDIESHANLEDALNAHEAAIAAMISEKEHRPVKLPLIK